MRHHHDQIHAVCRRLAGNDADAQDATQEALIAVVRGLGRFHGQSKFSTWAYRVATNAALDELRRKRRRASVIEASERFGAPGAGAGAAADHADAVVARLDLDAALAGLPEEFRAAVVLRDAAGFDYARIAEILGVAPGTVRSRIARGRRRLAAQVSSEALERDGSGHDSASGDAGNRSDATQRRTRREQDES
ncbi:MAG: RNA polymerase sigma factor [Acidimicrobiaceae bacterium]|nr:RNA polymerase sigma factor [Acidimicrobiaceae bacterium]